MHVKFYLLLQRSCYDNPLKHKNNLSITSKIYKFLQIKQIHLTLQVLKKILSIPSVRIQHKGQNQKLGNLRNSQLAPTKQLQALKKFPSFLSFWFQHKGQNRKLGKLGNSQFPQIKEIHSNSEVLKKFPSFLSFWFQYKGQNQKLGNLRNFQLPQTKQLQVLKKFLSFPSFWFQYKGQNRKLVNLGNFLLPQIKKSFEIYKSWKYFWVFLVLNFSIRAKIEKLETSEISNILK